MRSFWEQEPDEIVANTLLAMLDWHEANCHVHDKAVNSQALEKCRSILSNLLNNNNNESNIDKTKSVTQEFTMPDIDPLLIDPNQQLESNFEPNEHIAKLSLINLEGLLDHLAKSRS